MRIAGTVRSHRQREPLLLTLPSGPPPYLKKPQIVSVVSDSFRFDTPQAPVVVRAQGPITGFHVEESDATSIPVNEKAASYDLLAHLK